MKHLIKNASQFLRSNKETIKFYCEILTAIVSVISVIMVFLTLHEMQVQRNNAYKPDIIFETSSVAFSLGDPEKIDSYDNIINSDTSLNPASINIPIRNIGAGIAKNLSLTITSDSYSSWLSLLDELNSEKNYSFTKEGNRMIVSDGSKVVSLAANYTVKKTFLLANAEEKYEFILPEHYTALLREMVQTKKQAMADIPNLEILISFEDVQGISYNKKVSLAIKEDFSVLDSENNGLATYKICMN